MDKAPPRKLARGHSVPGGGVAKFCDPSRNLGGRYGVYHHPHIWKKLALSTTTARFLHKVYRHNTGPVQRILALRKLKLYNSKLSSAEYVLTL
jgi:hypothetical protein